MWWPFVCPIHCKKNQTTSVCMQFCNWITFKVADQSMVAWVAKPWSPRSWLLCLIRPSPLRFPFCATPAGLHRATCRGVYHPGVLLNRVARHQFAQTTPPTIAKSPPLRGRGSGIRLAYAPIGLSTGCTAPQIAGGCHSTPLHTPQ